MADRSELLENYYEELDPDKRRSLLDQYLSGSAPDDPVDRYRSALYDYRYTNPKEPGRKVDNYMWALLSLMYTHRESLIFPGRNVKAVRRIMKDLAQDERVHTDEIVPSLNQRADAVLARGKNHRAVIKLFRAAVFGKDIHIHAVAQNNQPIKHSVILQRRRGRDVFHLRGGIWIRTTIGLNHFQCVQMIILAFPEIIACNGRAHQNLWLTICPFFTGEICPEIFNGAAGRFKLHIFHQIIHPSGLERRYSSATA